jgi:hypothetical protein
MLTQKEHFQGLNVCDKCGKKEKSEDLIWITAEDFRPRKNEIVPKWVYKKYDALCEECYLDIINLDNKKIK